MCSAALRRKGKGDDVTEDDMDGFVAAHNGKSSTHGVGESNGL